MGINMYDHPNGVGFNITTNGSAPAGGCVVFVKTIIPMAVPTHKAVTITELPNNVLNSTPIVVVRTCPPIIFLGCDRGAAGAANASTQLAPNGAAIHGEELIRDNIRRINTAEKPPINPNILSCKLAFNVDLSFVNIFFK